MIKCELSFDVSLNIDNHNSMFISTLHNVTLHKKCGEIKGDINKNIYTISQSEIDENLRGLGLGYKFYVLTIKRCFEYGCTQFNSSSVLNEMSTGVWEKILREHYNITKTTKSGDVTYSVTKPQKTII